MMKKMAQRVPTSVAQVARLNPLEMVVACTLAC